MSTLKPYTVRLTYKATVDIELYATDSEDAWDFVNNEDRVKDIISYLKPGNAEGITLLDAEIKEADND